MRKAGLAKKSSEKSKPPALAAASAASSSAFSASSTCVRQRKDVINQLVVLAREIEARAGSVALCLLRL